MKSEEEKTKTEEKEKIEQKEIEKKEEKGQDKKEQEEQKKIEKKEENKDQNEEKEKSIKKEDLFFEVIKSPEWDKVVPHVIESIDKHNENNNYNTLEYPYFRIQNAVQYLPKLDNPSDILSTNQLKELHSRLPSYHQYSNLYRIFTISVDGSLLKTLYDKCEGINNSVLVVKDDEGNIFGGYASEEYKPNSKFGGTGECFLFTFYKGNKIHIYCSTGINDHYMYCDDEQICFGCSDDYFSLALRNNLLDGYSKRTQTYNNEPLNHRDKFVIVKLEVWGFKDKKANA